MEADGPIQRVAVAVAADSGEAEDKKMGVDRTLIWDHQDVVGLDWYPTRIGCFPVLLPILT